MQSFGEKSEVKGSHLEGLDADGEVNIKLILSK